LFFGPKLLPQKFRLDRFYLVFHRVHVPTYPPSLYLFGTLILFFKECVKGCQTYYWRPWCTWMSLLAIMIFWMKFILWKFIFSSMKFCLQTFMDGTSFIHLLKIHKWYFFVDIHPCNLDS
jgi:hypothetical protein